MAGPPRLRPEDRADFEAVLRLATNTVDAGTAVRVRARAFDAADEITAAAGEEYAAYLAVRSAAGRGTLLPALAVLTPILAAVSAAALLPLGYGLQLADVQGTLPASLVTAGLLLAAIAAVSAVVALAALLRTAVSERGGPPSAARVAEARLSWQHALLARGMVPHVTRCVHESPREPEEPDGSTDTPRTGPTCSE
ncbi:hypothetical protein SAMN04487983_101010 [Streptomyces sp. yr375]|nr:hypothetical protein SAMN04487983_101010 [Streptomyces sp. yr375]